MNRVEIYNKYKRLFTKLLKYNYMGLNISKGNMYEFITQLMY